MQAIEQTKSVEDILRDIEQLDLEPIKFKLMRDDDGEGWTQEQANHYERDYKRFLSLVIKYPNDDIVPSRAVDAFWHAHILDTRKYAEDCQNTFGYFLHHYPYFGLRGEADLAAQNDAVEVTRRLMEREFGVASNEAAWCAADKQKAAWCAADKQKAAWCAADKQKAAWCAADKQKAAWCAATKAMAA